MVVEAGNFLALDKGKGGSGDDSADMWLHGSA
jgi:hypothetical protein